jgi:dienelactone hydrolase
MKTFLVALFTLSLSANAAMLTKKVAYEFEKTKLEGVLLYEETSGTKPGLLMVPNWMGINEANLKQAQLIASRGYVVFVVDMYGTAVRPKTPDEAGKAAGALKDNRPLMRGRMQKALDVFLAQKSPLEAKKLAAIGFCFGGTAALELARSGAKIPAVVSFHGGLASASPEDAKKISGKVLVLHGADDPYVPAEEVTAFQAEMRAAQVDWQLVAYGNSVHSFTDPGSNMPGKAQYNPLVTARAYAAMDAFLVEAFAPK